MPTAQVRLRRVSSSAERRAQPITGIGQHTAEAGAACDHAIDFGKRDLRLRSCRPMCDRNAGPLQTSRIGAFFSSLAGIGAMPPSLALPRASVNDTSVWQLAVFPSADAYCGETPTECSPFFGMAVSSITSTASPPPTSLSAWTRSSASSGAASRRPQQRNGATGHSHPAQTARPSAQRSCDHPARSAPPRKADTSAAVPGDPAVPERLEPAPKLPLPIRPRAFMVGPSISRPPINH